MIGRFAQVVLVIALGGALGFLGGALGFLGLGSGTAPGTAPAPGTPPHRDLAPLLDAPLAAAPATRVPLPTPETYDPEAEPAEPISDAERLNRKAVTLATNGDMADAAGQLRAALVLEPSSELYQRNLQAVLINTGFAAIEAERFDAAVGSFVEALSLGDRGEIHRGLGYAYYRLGKIDLARISLERVLELDGGDADTWLTLGRIYLEKRDHPRALAMLMEARAAGANTRGLDDTIARLQRDADAEEGFHALASSHFVLKFEGRENTQAGRLVLNALEEAYRKVGARFAYYPLERIEVVLYADEEFRAITNSPHWSGAVYDGRIKMPIGGLKRGSERLKRTLRHEYAHAAIVTLSRGKAPVWLNEGLAQVAEEPQGQGRMQRLRMGLEADELMSLLDLEGDFTRLNRDQASLAYSQAYFAARHLLEKKGAYNVRRLLEKLATAETVDAAFRGTFSQPYATFERDVLRALRRALG